MSWNTPSNLRAARALFVGGVGFVVLSAVMVVSGYEPPPWMLSGPSVAIQVLIVTIFYLAAGIRHLWRELNRLSTPAMRKLFRTHNVDEFLDKMIETHKERREFEWAVERHAWLADREEWKGQQMQELYEQILGQVERGHFCPKCRADRGDS